MIHNLYPYCTGLGKEKPLDHADAGQLVEWRTCRGSTPCSNWKDSTKAKTKEGRVVSLFLRSNDTSVQSSNMQGMRKNYIRFSIPVEPPLDVTNNNSVIMTEFSVKITTFIYLNSYNIFVTLRLKMTNIQFIH